jgi:hypothetical protein
VASAQIDRDIKGDGFCDEPVYIGGFTQLAFL